MVDGSWIVIELWLMNSQRESRWKLKQKMDSIKSYETKMAESSDGHRQNIRKYVVDQAMLTSKDLKPAEDSIKFLSGIINEIDTFIVECKTLRANLFHRENTVKPWKANELLLLEKIIKELLAVHAKMVKTKGDILQNVGGYLKRRVLENDAIQHDNTRSNRRMKENKRKASKRKERRRLKSCYRVLQEIIGSMLLKK